MRAINFTLLGSNVSYETAFGVQLKLQKRILESLKTDSKTINHLLLVQHPPTFTTGMRIKEDNNSDEAKRLKALGAEYFQASEYLF